MCQLIELCTGESNIKVLRAGCIGCDVRQVDVAGGYAAQLNLCLLGSLTQTLHSNLIAAQINAFRLLELCHQIIGNALIKVVAAETVVAGRCENFNNTVADFQNGHIEGAAAEVVNHDLLVIFFIKPIGKSCCGRLVDDTLYFKACNLAGVLCCLTLCIREVCRNRDDCFGNRLSEVSFGICLQLLENHCGNLLRGIGLVVDGHFVVGAHFTFDGGNGAVRVGNSLAFCHLAYHSFAVFGKCHDGRCGACAFSVCNNGCFSAFENCNAAVCCTEVYTNNFTHDVYLLFILYNFNWRL